jgi:1-acyl-sn-glycerol-3-phosphate acyltransferase
MKAWLGSIAFTTILFVSVVIYGPIAIVVRLFGDRAFYAAVVLWCRTMLALLRVFCGLDHRISGLEHVPADNTVVLMKHSSAWETIAQLTLFPKQTWVLKRELLWAPILGWAIYLLKPIAINRKAGRTAVEQVIAQGQQRLGEGLWVLIFPEGTRVPAGQTKRFGLSGTLLAQAAGRSIVPVAHNAGFYWPRRGLRKRPGTIDVVIGEPVPTADRDPRELTEEIQCWIESQISRMQKPTP